MKKTIVTCDACNNPNDIGAMSEFFVYIDRKMDAAGSMESQHDQIALCHKCCIRIFTRHLESAIASPIPQQREFMKLVTTMKREAK